MCEAHVPLCIAQHDNNVLLVAEVVSFWSTISNCVMWNWNCESDFRYKWSFESRKKKDIIDRWGNSAKLSHLSLSSSSLKCPVPVIISKNYFPHIKCHLLQFQRIIRSYSSTFLKIHFMSNIWLCTRTEDARKFSEMIVADYVMELHTVIRDINVATDKSATHRWHGCVLVHNTHPLEGAASVQSQFSVQEIFNCVEAFCRLGREAT